jgi:hypothetical protein
MGRTLVLHIGTNKTGSTTLQNLLCANRPLLLPQGAYYADTQRGANHLLLATMFTSFKRELEDVQKEIWRGRDPLLYLNDYRKDLRAEIEALPPHVRQVIVSSEHFAQAVRKPDDLRRLKSFFDDMFDDYKVVVYLRRQDAHFASSFSQGLRGGRLQSPGFRKLNAYFYDYDYADLLNRWAAVFGDAAMLPRIYGRDTDKTFDICKDFTDLLGLAPLVAAEDDEAARNLSISTSGQRILLRLGRALREETGKGFGNTALWFRLASSVSEVLPGRGWRPTQKEARAFVDSYAETNEAVRQRWFPDRATLFPMDFSSLPIAAEAEDPQTDYENACAVLVHFARKSAARELEMARRKADFAARANEPRMRKGALVQALRLDPKDAEARFRLAAIQIGEKAFAAARRNIELALEIAPGNPAGTKLTERLKRVERRTFAQFAKKRGGGEAAEVPQEEPSLTDAA